MEVTMTGRDDSPEPCAPFDLFLWRMFGFALCLALLAFVVMFVGWGASELHCLWDPEARRCVVLEERSKGDWP